MRATSATAAAPHVLPETPYVGLTPFGERDARFYFGRERERRLLAASILSSRLTLLYGASGVGKSSLLRAGLAADFRARAHAAVARGRVPESVLIVCAAWRDDPLRALADAIEAAVRDELLELAPEPPPFTPRLEELLAEWIRRLDDRAVGLAPDADEPPRSELLLVLDQFEEYFLYHPDEDGDGTLALELPRAVMREDLRASFLVSIREDAYTQLDRFEGRIRNLFGSNFRLEHLDEPAARRAVEGPVERYNELLPGGAAGYAVEPGLVDDVLEQVRAGTISLGQAGGGTVETDGAADLRVATPFLQLVLTRLWEEERRAGSRTLRAATLERLGGAERLVRSHLDEALAELDDHARDLTAGVFHQLVTPSGTKIVHTVPDLADYAGVPADELTPVLEALAAARILRPVDPAPGETSRRFEIFHDVLAPAILDWRAAHERARAARKEAARLRRVRRRLAAGAGGMLLLVLVFAGLALWALDSQREARSQQREARRQAELSRSQALAASAFSELEADPELGLLLALEATGGSQRPKQAEDALRRALTASRLRAVVAPRSGPVRSVAVSRDDSRLLTVDGKGNAHVQPATGGGSGTFSFGAGLVNGATFDPSGGLVVTANADGTARIFDASDGRERLVLRAGSAPVLAVRYSRDGRRVLTIARDGAARVFDARTGDPGGVVRVRPPLRRSLDSPGGEAVAVVGQGGGARVWRWQAGEPPRSLDLSDLVDEYSVGALADDGSVALGGPVALVPGQQPDAITSPLRIIDGRSGRSRTIFLPAGALTIAFAPRGRLVASAGSETARLRDLRAERFGRPLPDLRGHVGTIVDLAFAPGGETLLTVSEDGSARLWRAATGQQLAVFRDRNGPTRGLFSPSGKLVVTRSESGQVRVWAADAVPTRFVRRLPPAFESPGIGTIAFTPDGSHLLAGGQNGAWTLDTDAGEVRHAFLPPAMPSTLEGSPDGRLVAHAGGVQDVVTGRWRLRTELRSWAFSANSRWLAFLGGDGRVAVWDGRSGDVRILGHDPDAYELGFTRDGAVAASGFEATRVWPSGGGPPRKVREGEGPYAAVAEGLGATLGKGRVHLWRGGAPAGDLNNPTGGDITGIAFSPDGLRAATTDEQGTARVWDLATRDSRALRGHVGEVTSLAFSPDSGLVVTAGLDGTARVWRAATGASVAVLGDGGQPVLSAEFSPNGRFVATGGADRVVRLYDCEPCRPFAELLALARERATRKLTPQERREFLGEE